MSLIIETLAKLDPENDEHWTTDGLPRLDVLKAMGLDISRVDLSNAVKGFGRKSTHVLAQLQPQTNEAPAPTEPAEAVETVVTEGEVVAKSYEEQEAELASAQAELEAATKAVEEAMQNFDGARKLLDEANARYDQAVRLVELETYESKQAQMAATVSAYQRSQHELRMQGKESF